MLYSFLVMLFNRVVNGIIFAILLTKIGGRLDILFSVLDIDLSMFYISWDSQIDFATVFKNQVSRILLCLYAIAWMSSGFLWNFFLVDIIFFQLLAVCPYSYYPFHGLSISWGTLFCSIWEGVLW